MISIKDVSVVYGQERALDGVRLQIKKGTALAIIGHSGSGKSTLLNVLAGLIQPSSGQIDLYTPHLTTNSPTISLIMQSASLYPWMTVADNVGIGLDNKKYPVSELKQKVDKVLAEVGLLEHRNKYPAQLSGGQAQRASIARSWILKPDILLLDEPTSSLDAITKEGIQVLLKEHQLRSHNTTLVVTHSIEEAVFLGGNIVILHEGRIVAQFENDCYTLENARDHKSFYDKVLEIRNAFKEVHTIEHG